MVYIIKGETEWSAKRLYIKTQKNSTRNINDLGLSTCIPFGRMGKTYKVYRAKKRRERKVILGLCRRKVGYNKN